MTTPSPTPEEIDAATKAILELLKGLGCFFAWNDTAKTVDLNRSLATDALKAAMAVRKP